MLIAGRAAAPQAELRPFGRRLVQCGAGAVGLVAGAGGGVAGPAVRTVARPGRGPVSGPGAVRRHGLRRRSSCPHHPSTLPKGCDGGFSCRVPRRTLWRFGVDGQTLEAVSEEDLNRLVVLLLRLAIDSRHLAGDVAGLLAKLCVEPAREHWSAAQN